MDVQYTYSEKPTGLTPGLKISAIVLRILINVFLFLSLIILITKVNLKGLDDDIALHFYDYVGYRYMTSTIVIGGAYSIWQTVTSVIRYNKGYEGNLMLDYYGDKISIYTGAVMSLTLATGSVAGFVMTGELQRELRPIYHDKFFTMGYAADGFVFLGFICALIRTEIASYALMRF